eukprot:scaffold33987_cov124-Isochrysis_galbana.AAC.5
MATQKTKSSAREGETLLDADGGGTSGSRAVDGVKKFAAIGADEKVGLGGEDGVKEGGYPGEARVFGNASEEDGAVNGIVRVGDVAMSTLSVTKLRLCSRRRRVPCTRVETPPVWRWRQYWVRACSATHNTRIDTHIHVWIPVSFNEHIRT